METKKLIQEIETEETELFERKNKDKEKVILG
jgi:hypothetical protein